MKKLQALYQRHPVTGKQMQTLAIDQLYYLLACLCYAAGIVMFSVPNRIAQSGVSGLAVIANHLLQVPIGASNFALNVPLIILALVFVGWRFVSKTLWVTLELSIVIDLLVRFVPYTYTHDRLLAALFGGALQGIGIALALSRGATTGGTDIVGWLVRKRWPHMSLGRIITASNAVVVALGAITFRDINSALYAAVMIFIGGRIVDSMLYGMNNGKMFYIFSKHADDIAPAILKELERSVTILPAKGAFSGETQQMLLCVVRRNEVTRLRRLVRAHDPESFMVIAEAQEIFGRGFGRE